MADGRFRRQPRPNPEVIDLLERVLKSARDGQISTLLVIASNRLHRAETVTAGDLSDVHTNVLLAELTRAAAKLIR